jgi:hypothetical protein
MDSPLLRAAAAAAQRPAARAGSLASLRQTNAVLPGHLAVSLPNKGAALGIPAEPLPGCQYLRARSTRLGPLCGSQRVHPSAGAVRLGRLLLAGSVLAATPGVVWRSVTVDAHLRVTTNVTWQGEILPLSERHCLS